MANPFSTPIMAAGYAASRPPVHSHVIELVRGSLGHQRVFERALDVGCGAGLSTRALQGIAGHCLGLEPAAGMLRQASQIAPQAAFIVGAAEAIPLQTGSVDIITAAGSLNYVNLNLFFAEAARILRPPGVLVVYDFQTGRTFRDSHVLDDWFASFVDRYPWPPGEACELNSDILDRLDSGFCFTHQEKFEIGLTLKPEFYLEYVLSETNVAFAVRTGGHYDEIRAWCMRTLSPIWEGKERQVLFFGYLVCMRPE